MVPQDRVRGEREGSSALVLEDEWLWGVPPEEQHWSHSSQWAAWEAVWCTVG